MALDPQNEKAMAAVVEFVAGALDQHRTAGLEACSCGWTPRRPDRDYDWSHHVAAVAVLATMLFLDGEREKRKMSN